MYITLDDYHQAYKIYSKIEIEIMPLVFRNVTDFIRMNYDEKY